MLSDEPAILIKGAEEVSCGETALFDAEVKQNRNIIQNRRYVIRIKISISSVVTFKLC